MALSSAQFQTWLENTSVIRCVLVKIDYNDSNGVSSDKTLYLSNRIFISDTSGKSGEIPNNQPFNPILTSGIDFTESISLSGTPSVNYGDISIDNSDGANDSYLNYIWANKPVSIYVGDLFDTTDNFTKVFSGLSSDITIKDRNTLSINLRDISQRLNTSITDQLVSSGVGSISGTTLTVTVAPSYPIGPGTVLYGGNVTVNTTITGLGTGTTGTGTYIVSTSQTVASGTVIQFKPTNVSNGDAVLPLTFGEVHNISPVLIDAANLVYMVHNGPIEGIIEVRDNGVPLALTTGYTVDVSKGTFKLLAASAGVITCSVQGDKPSSGYITGYNNTISNIIKRIVTTYGTNPLSSSDLDLTAFTTFASANTQAVGLYLDSKTNIIEVCQQLANSVGAWVGASKAGLLTITAIAVPVAGTKTVTDEDIIKDSLSATEKLPVSGAVKLGYCRNWTVQDSLQTRITQQQKDMYAQEYYQIVKKNSTVLTNYKITAEPELEVTLLITNSSNEADTEAQRRLTLYSTPRYIYTMDCTINLATVVLGEMITIQHYRFGMSAGKYAQIFSISTNWDTGIVKLGVLV